MNTSPVTPRKRAAIRSALSAAMAIGLVAGFATDAALAQPKDKKKQEELKPPVPPNDKEMPTHYWGLAALLLGIGFVTAANLIPSKRGHQD